MSRVLIVDGNEGDLARTSMMLGAQGHEVEDAPDGVEAFDKLLAAAYDVIITEAELEKLPLSELIAKLRARGVKTPVLALTAATEASAISALLKMGVVGHIPKVSPPEVLRSKLAELLGPSSAGENRSATASAVP